QGLGARLEYDQGPRSMGRRTAQHVEADAAGRTMVSWGQPAPVPPLLAVPFPAVESALRGHRDAGLWPASCLSQGLGFHSARWPPKPSKRGLSRTTRPLREHCGILSCIRPSTSNPQGEADHRLTTETPRTNGDKGGQSIGIFIVFVDLFVRCVRSGRRGRRFESYHSDHLSI